MNRYEGMIGRVVAISLMAMMIFVGAVPFTYGVYAEDGPPWTVEWKSQDGSTTIETDRVEDGAYPSFDGEEPTKEADEEYIYTFNGWAEDPNQEEGRPVGELDPVTEDKTYYAAFSKKKNIEKPATPTITEKTAGFQRVHLKWTAVSSPKGAEGATVYYKVVMRRMGYNKSKQWVTLETTEVYNNTGTECTPDFDPYPGWDDGRARSGNTWQSAFGNKPIFEVYAYIKDPEVVYSDPARTEAIEVIHPMYVIVQAKGKAPLLKTSSSTATVGKTANNQYLVAFGGSRIKGENKRVIIKVKNKSTGKYEFRYIKQGKVKIKRYVYKAQVGKNYYSGKTPYSYTYKQIEDFINDKKPASNNNFFIYVDTYHQRCYLLKRASSGERWYIATKYKYHDLLASTGRQLSPYGSYKVANTMAKKKTTGTKWWLLFNAIGIHEKLGEALGKPASGGCIRVPDPASKWFFDNIKKGTGIFIY